MYNRILSFFIGALVFPMSLFAAIYEIHSMQELKSHFKEENTLGIFDVDETLTISSEPAFQRPNLEVHRELIRKILKSLSKEEIHLLLNAMLASAPSLLIEEETPLILSSLQKKGIKLMALTAASSGHVMGTFIPDLRYQELKKHDIDFSSSFPHLQDMEFTDLKQNCGSHPLFTKGILLVNGDSARINKDWLSKADVLLHFFEKTSFYPQKIVFVDDKKEHLEEMEKALSHLNIPFIGLHYHGAKTFPSEKLDAKVMETRWNDIVKKLKEQK